MLDFNSPRASQIKDTKFPLWSHQLAMLQRCMDIEASTDDLIVKVFPSNNEFYSAETQKNLKHTEHKIAIMNDPPGCGKTHVMLALIKSDWDSSFQTHQSHQPHQPHKSHQSVYHQYQHQNQHTMIVVPENIIGQWFEAIESFFTSTFCSNHVSCIKDYASMMDFDFLIRKDPNNKYIILVSASLAERLSANLTCKRIIIDEVDKATNVFKSLPEKSSCERIWFMSASFDVSNVDSRSIGPFNLDKSMPNREIERIVCRCDPAFADMQSSLLEPSVLKLVMNDGDISSLISLVGKHGKYGLDKIEYMSRLNVFDIKGVAKKILSITSFDDFQKGGQCNIKAFMILWLCDLVKKKELFEIDHPNDEPDYLLNDMIDELKRKVDSLFDKPKEEKDGNTFEHTDKMSYVKEVLAKIKISEGQKWLIVSDHSCIFETIVEILEGNGMKNQYTTLSEGSLLKNEKACQLYKERASHVRILLMNSMEDGSGLNLEVTTHIMFLHKTDERFVAQVIGRAQRPGREKGSRLEVIHLLHENENA